MIRRLLPVFLILAAPAGLRAQAYQCSVPERLSRPVAEGPSVREPRRVVPIGGYTLALIWSPESCRGRSGDTALACSGGNRFGFTLHGLWPDGRGATWPQYCAPAPLLSERVIRQNLCATPSVQLLQHEYAKHGTCMGVPPAAYFTRATGLYRAVHYPDMAALAARRNLTAGQFAAAFARVNPGMTVDMVRPRLNRRGWLEEVWVCLDTNFRQRRCPRGGTASTAAVRIEPPRRGR